MLVRFRVPWNKERFFEGKLLWISTTTDWCTVKVPGQFCPISLPYSKVREVVAV
jgi:hypothetical protein